MRIIWYFLTFVFGLFGTLAALRTVERAATGAGIIPQQAAIALVALLLAAVCVKKARGPAAQS